MLWNHSNGTIVSLVGPESAGEMVQASRTLFQLEAGIPFGGVVGFSASERGRRVAVVRTEVAESSTISLLSLDTGKSISLVDQTGPLLGMSISPDGQRVVYIPQDLPPDSGQAPTATPSSTADPPSLVVGLPAPFLGSIGEFHLAARMRHADAGGGLMSGKIIVVRTDAPNQLQEMGHCVEIDVSLNYRLGCRGVLWSPDGSSLVWGDGQGIWLSNLKAPARLVASNYNAPPNTRGSFTYAPDSWSPVGRYVLLAVNYYEGGSRAILDTQTGHVGGIPHSDEYVGPSALISWMRDGRLFIIRPGDATTGVGSVGEIWHINPASAELLSRDKVFPISLASESYPGAPVQLESGRLAFAMLNASGTNYLERGLYILESDAFIPRKVIGLPPAWSDEWHDFAVQVFWAPDGNGAIVRDQFANWLLYASTNTGAIYDLQQIVSQNVCCFTWTQ